MLPIDLKKVSLNLPRENNSDIVIVTGEELRYKMFAHKLIEEFGDLVAAWYELYDDNDVGMRNGYRIDCRRFESRYLKRVKNGLNYCSKNGFASTIKRAFSVYTDGRIMSGYVRNITESERRFCLQELRELKSFQISKPERINYCETFKGSLIKKIEGSNAYFVIILDHNISKWSLGRLSKGVTLRLNVGHYPVLNGRYAIEWALYHRNLDLVSCSVLIKTPADKGEYILRRSNPCITPGDDIWTILCRAIALGAELIIESVREIMTNRNVAGFVTSREYEKPYLTAKFDVSMMKLLMRDFRAGWLQTELSRRRKF